MYTAKTSSSARLRGFTIVELLVVIVVIAILTGLTMVAYAGVQRRTTESIMQTTAKEIAKAMETQKVDLGLYPAVIPESIITTPGTGIAVTQVGDTNSFCFNVTTIKYNDIVYSIDQTLNISETLCPGQVLATKGDYNASAGGAVADSWVSASSVGKSVAPGDMEFTAETNETWSQVTLSWKAMSGATQYRINQQDSAAGTWYVRSGTGAGYSWDLNSYSGNISSSTTSVVWTYAIPTALDQAYGYRIQYKKADGTWSDWQQLSLSPATGRTIPTIRNFKVTPNENWSSIAISWDDIGNFAKLPNVKFRINQRDSPTGTWYVRSGTGAGYSWDLNSYSGALSPTTTSQTWTYAIPTDASKVYEYRIQVYSGSVAGAWTTFTLNPLEGITLPKVSNFTVTPNTDWSNITLAWNDIGAYANLPSVKFRINQRDSPTGTWYVRSGTGAGYNWDLNSYSGALSPTTTSQIWTYAIPTDASKIYEYRIQAYSGTAVGEWTTVTLNPLQGTSLPQVANFQVVPAADWSKITFSWNSIGSYANLPNVKLRINQRELPSTTWYVRSGTGAGYSWDLNSYSGALPPTSTSSEWTYAMPTSGKTFEYRIQPYSGTASGDWAVFSLSR